MEEGPMTEYHDAESLPSFPFVSGSILRPPEEYAKYRKECPLGQVRLVTGGVGRLLASFADVSVAARDPRLTRNHIVDGVSRAFRSSSVLDDPEVMNNKSDEDHRRIRRTFALGFTRAAADSFRPTIRAIIDRLADDIERTGPGADLATQFCEPMPIQSTCAMFELDQSDWPAIRDWSFATTPGSVAMPDEQRLAMQTALADYAENLVAQRRARPRHTLIEELIAAADDGTLSHPELLSTVRMLIGSGHVFMAGVLGRSLLSLIIGDRDPWRRLVADPSLIDAAVNELLRYNALLEGAAPRYAVADVPLPSGTVRAGETALLSWSAALRDPEVFPDPDVLRFDRPPQKELAFGGGAHVCPGAFLVKAQMQITLQVLTERFPDLRLAVDAAEVRLTDGEMPGALVSLPVSW
jgi:cytochrome P450